VKHFISDFRIDSEAVLKRGFKPKKRYSRQTIPV